MGVGDLVKIGTLIGGILGAWLFLSTHFATADAMEQQSEKLNESLTMLQIDITEDRIYRLNLKNGLSIEDKAMLKKLERRLERLETQLDEY